MLTESLAISVIFRSQGLDKKIKASLAKIQFE